MVEVMCGNKSERIRSKSEGSEVMGWVVTPSMAGTCAFVEGDPEGLSAKGCTAGGDELALRRGGEGVGAESESEISSMSSHSDCANG